MIHSFRPYVQLAVNAVDLVLLDQEGHFDGDQYDRYETFDAARDAALTSVEVMLDEGDYDDEEHREDLEAMRRLLESATSFEDLESEPSYRQFHESLSLAQSAA